MLLLLLSTSQPSGGGRFCKAVVEGGVLGRAPTEGSSSEYITTRSPDGPHKQFSTRERLTKQAT